ncbi:MAG: glycosyltransferase [Lachnospiraceae bacterium]|nr:glycosyltransferase [Lachnospiraceae bacterium]
MTLTFISNYINHHQIPFCEACHAALGDGFTFVETEPMEEERRSMGWDAGEKPPYVIRAYETPELAEKKVLEADIALFGWAQREDLIRRRMAAGRPTVRVSERIYREGQWKMISPRGLMHKYGEHIRYRRKPLWLLAVGAYTASDFALLHAYPDRMYRWGYFPPRIEAASAAGENDPAEPVRILWAGRFLPLKHPDYAILAAKYLKEHGIPFRLTVVGDGEMRGTLENEARKMHVAEDITWTGFLTPAETRGQMQKSDVFLFTSDHLEGWGAVVSEAMDAGLAVLAGSEAGGPVTLIRPGENGLLYDRNDADDLCRRLGKLLTTPGEVRRLGRAARETIDTAWNAEEAARRFMEFCDCILNGKPYQAPADGPMSKDPAIRPFVTVGGRVENPAILTERDSDADADLPKEKLQVKRASQPSGAGPSVSVIVPAYNTGRYLIDCLNSLTAQTLLPEDLEIIVVDDGSTDDTGHIADAYAAEHPQVRVIHQDNAGSSAARNTGIENAHGRYLGFVDSDDIVAPGMYEAMLSCAERTAARIIQTGRDEFSPEGETLPSVVRIPEEETRILPEEMLFSLLLHEGDASLCTKLVDRQLLTPRMRFPERELNEDFHLLVRLLEHTDGIISLPRCDYHVVYRTGSNSRKDRDQEDYFPPVFTDIVRNADRVRGLVERRHPELRPAAQRFALVQRLDYLLHIPVGMMNRKNTFYRDVVRYIRGHIKDILLNPYLNGKERRNLLLLCVAPALLRRAHKRVKHL